MLKELLGTLPTPNKVNNKVLMVVNAMYTIKIFKKIECLYGYTLTKVGRFGEYTISIEFCVNGIEEERLLSMVKVIEGVILNIYKSYIGILVCYLHVNRYGKK